MASKKVKTTDVEGQLSLLTVSVVTFYVNRRAFLHCLFNNSKPQKMTAEHYAVGNFEGDLNLGCDSGSVMTYT